MINEEQKNEILGFDEVTSYFFIDLIGGILWRTQHDASHGRLTITPEIEIGLQELSEQQVFCVQQLTKFGIDPESAKNRPDGDYWKWFTHWDEWKRNMSDEEWDILDTKMRNKEDISELLPKNKWNESPN